VNWTDRLGSVKPLEIQVRAGLHTGEIELDGTDVAGLAVAIAARWPRSPDPTS
jgi:class 3 adenylate cyclase